MALSRTRFLLVSIAILCLSACDRAQVAAVLAEHGVTDETTVALAHAGITAKTAATAALVPSDAALKRLRDCESTNNYQAVNKSGEYRGAYQFDLRTWRSVNGAGTDPAAATPAEQDAAARRLYAKRGRTPWPECGKRL